MIEGYACPERVVGQDRPRCARIGQQRLEVFREGAHAKLVGEVRIAVSPEVERDHVEASGHRLAERPPPVDVRAAGVEPHERRVGRVAVVERVPRDARPFGPREAGFVPPRATSIPREIVIRLPVEIGLVEPKYAVFRFSSDTGAPMMRRREPREPKGEARTPNAEQG